MKRMIGLVLGLVLALAGIGAAWAETWVNLPGSAYALALPDGMTYDGPGEQDGALFAYVDEGIGLDIHFFRYDAGEAQLKPMAKKLREKGFDAKITTIAGIDMIVYRTESTTGDGMKAIGYILLDGSSVQEIVFWYATQKAADMTKTIMETITDN